MRVVLAPDSFKGSLSAAEFCRITTEALAGEPHIHAVTATPLADGGEGTAAALLAARPGHWVPRRVHGPLPGQGVAAGFAWWPDTREALVELAAAAGLTLIPPERRDPLRTTTRGVGELLRAAADQGARRILLALGGSGTVDGGTGAAAALGWRFKNAAGRILPEGGAALAELARIVPPEGPPLPPVEVLCDVDNPLYGPEGAAAVYGPQKGADAVAVARLDAGLRRLAAVVRAQMGVDIGALPGAGAAGGMGAGALAFLGGRLVSGVETIMALSGLPEALKQADWVLTGEGSFDAQSLRGKAVSGVVRAARAAGVRVAVLAGRVTLAPGEWRAAGVDHADAITPADMGLEEALNRAPELLTAAVRRWRTLATGAG